MVGTTPSPKVEAFAITFEPAARAVRLLVEIANNPDLPHAYRERARNALEVWRGSLATADQIAMLETNDELEVDDAGACVSEGHDGFFIQTWTWVARSRFADWKEAVENDETRLGYDAWLAAQEEGG